MKFEEGLKPGLTDSSHHLLHRIWPNLEVPSVPPRGSRAVEEGITQFSTRGLMPTRGIWEFGI